MNTANIHICPNILGCKEIHGQRLRPVTDRACKIVITSGKSIYGVLIDTTDGSVVYMDLLGFVTTIPEVNIEQIVKGLRLWIAEKENQIRYAIVAPEHIPLGDVDFHSGILANDLGMSFEQMVDKHAPIQAKVGLESDPPTISLGCDSRVSKG